MGIMSRATRGVAVAACVALGSCGGGGSSGASGPLVLIPLNQSYAGYSYADLAGGWWNWCSSIAYATNPVASDPTGALAGVGQDGPIWFLAGTFGGFAERTVTIPAGKALFFPLFNSAFWLPEDAPSLAACATLAAGGPDTATALECEVDGHSLGNMFDQRVPAGPFLLDIPPLGIFTEPIFGGYAPGTRTSMADGFWVFLKPLPAGPHEIHLHGEAPGFDTEVLYHLTVQ